MELNELNKNAMGGTELMMKRLHDSIDQDLLDRFQIIGSRVRELKEDKVRILWLHDLPADPESAHLANGGWKKFHKLVFVSNWQMQRYIQAYDIPWSHCVVMRNAIEPFGADALEKPDDVINIAYWSTPHRGLNILIPVFEKLAEDHDNIKLHVFSSFNLYGWGERDKPYEELFERCRQHPKIEYYGSLPNAELREHIKKMHILAYPSTWVETSCLVLMEAMSAGLNCVHSDLGALYETAANLTTMYHFDEDQNRHAGLFYQIMRGTIQSNEGFKRNAAVQQAYANMAHSWEYRKSQWEALLLSLKDSPTDLPKDDVEYFTYSI